MGDSREGGFRSPLDFHNIAEGSEVAILANGPGLQEHLDQLGDIPTIGINASLQYHPSRYHVALDAAQLQAIPDMKYAPEVVFTTNLPYGLVPYTTCVLDSRFSDFGWSKDLTDCIYTGKAAVWFALQIAAWMGYEDIYLVGFDLYGLRPEGHVHSESEIPRGSIDRQLELMGYLRGLIDAGAIDQRVFICSETNPCDSIPKVRFANRQFLKATKYEPQLDVNISITRNPQSIGGGKRVEIPAGVI